MINDNKKDDGKNDGGVDDPFDDSKELVAVSIEAAEPTEVVGDKGGQSGSLMVNACVLSVGSDAKNLGMSSTTTSLT